MPAQTDPFGRASSCYYRGWLEVNTFDALGDVVGEQDIGRIDRSITPDAVGTVAAADMTIAGIIVEEQTDNEVEAIFEQYETQSSLSSSLQQRHLELGQHFTCD